MPKVIHGITVAHFLETYGAKLRLDLICGREGLHRLIREPAINRPALALTGFFKYFANKRIQVLGAAEIDVEECAVPKVSYSLSERVGKGASPLSCLMVCS